MVTIKSVDENDKEIVEMHRQSFSSYRYKEVEVVPRESRMIRTSLFCTQEMGSLFNIGSIANNRAQSQFRMKQKIDPFYSDDNKETENSFDYNSNYNSNNTCSGINLLKNNRYEEQNLSLMMPIRDSGRLG